jgi:excisionase family DNA binding protein
MGDTEFHNIVREQGEPPRHDEHLLTIREVAQLLQVPVSWVYGRVRKGSRDRMPGYRLGKYWRFREAEVIAWLARQRANAFTHL